ncbi:MAG: ComEC/Rec2 family competence protein [Eubacterium sp.]
MKKKKLPFAVVILLVALISAISVLNNTDYGKNTALDTASNNKDNLVVTYVDVGQGDCEFIQLPGGECMLIDSGEADYADAVTETITSLGYDTIDYIVATHPHTDHIGGMAQIIESFNVKSIYMPRASSNTKTFESLLQTVSDKGLQIDTAKAGVEIDTSNSSLKMEFLAPVNSEYDDLNNYSAVLKITYGTTSFLFTGDAEMLAENEMLEASYSDLDCDVLKVGHHGSKYSSGSRFLEAVSPDYAVIECGSNNSYGHPHKEALDRLNETGAQILRTDKTGDITITSDGEKITVG